MPLLMGLAGGVGAVGRFVVDQQLRARFGGGLPLGTVLVNVLGSALLGALTALTVRGAASPGLLLVWGTGFCGGFTTFSTASLEVVELARAGRVLAALAHLLGGICCCLVAAAVCFGLVWGATGA
ncbi:fluoride efflux transporter CrcB [Luteococcus sp. OSA5]|uniref:fluoride efflux transporter CrcB n=1 Tax=Luteococcus sp. OSA5 TaxID=3401630 RepID=UPI003B43BF78